MPRGSAVIAYHRKDGDVTFRVKYADASGAQIQETLGRRSQGWTRRKAEAELRDRLVRVEKKAWSRPKPLTLSEYAEPWLEERMKKRGLKRSSVRAYRGALEHLKAKLGHLALAEITPRHLAQYTRESLERLSPTTVNYNLSILSDLFGTALREELVDRNPVTLVERPKLRPRQWRILSTVEVPRVAREFTDERARLVYQALVLTGMRRHELQNLRWSDVDLLENAVRVRESKSEAGRRTIAIPPAFADALWQYRRTATYRADEDYVFAHPRKGSRLDPDWYAKQFRAACKKARVEAPERPMHDLRHGALTHYAVAGNPIALMTMAGHRTMASTRPYLHLAGQTFPEEAAALEKRYGATLYPVLYPSESTSADPATPEPLEKDGSDLS